MIRILAVIRVRNLFERDKPGKEIVHDSAYAIDISIAGVLLVAAISALSAL